MMSRRLGPALAALCCCALLSCSKPPQQQADLSETDSGVSAATEPPPPPATLQDVNPVSSTDASTLALTLSDGSPPPDEASLNKRAQTTPLSGAQAQRILSRLPALTAEAGDNKDFALRDRSQPPPRPGETIKAPFPPVEPPPATSAQAAKQPLAIARFMPQGEVDIAPQVSITFNQPMIAVTSHADTLKAGIPVNLEPQPPGKWRWIGTQSLLFEPTQQRLPMATTYTLSVPAGTRSASGQTLATGFSESFTTPTLKLTAVHPQGVSTRQPVIVLAFDQRVDPQALLPHLSINVDKSKHALRLATAAELEADEGARALIEQAQPNTTVAIIPQEQLPHDRGVLVTLASGAKGTEGPNPTASELNHTFRTYGPLRITRHYCTYDARPEQCDPSDALQIELSNVIDAERFDPASIVVEPKIEDMQVVASGNYIHVRGYKQGRRTYRVTLPTSMRDIYDQSLAKAETFEFKIGSMIPVMTSPAPPMVVLDPAAEPELSLFSVNYSTLEAKLYQVAPKDWPAFLVYHQDHSSYGAQKKKLPGKLIATRKLTVKGELDALVETRVPLGQALNKAGLGHVVVQVRPLQIMKGAKMEEPEYRQTFHHWVQATRIGLDAFVDHGQLLGWANDLRTGAPLAGVTLSTYVGQASGKTGPDGLATLALNETGRDGEHPEHLIATLGDDSALMPNHSIQHYYYYGGGGGWLKRAQYNQARWYVFDDRAMYRPGEEVHVKGWVRMIEQRTEGDVALPSERRDLTFEVRDAQYNKIADGKASTDAMGGFDLKFTLPTTPNLGNARLILSASGELGGHQHNFQIQEFRRPEFEVKTRVEGEGPHLAGKQALVAVEAGYYAGGALPGAETSWQVTSRPASFTPPNQSKYTFGAWTPWWSTPEVSAAEVKQLQAKTDAAGQHILRVGFGEIAPPRPMSVQAQATVMDVNRQAWTATATLLVHPSTHYVGMRSDRYFVEQGQPLEVQVVVSDLDGILLPDRPVKVQAHRMTWKYEKGKYVEVRLDEQSCELMTTAKEHTCTFETPRGGTYQLTATTTDDYGRHHYTQLTRWVSGEAEVKPARQVGQLSATLIPDKDNYKPGDKAKLLVQSPFVPAEGLLTVRRHGIATQRRFTMTESAMTLEVPILATHTPNVHVQVDLIGAAPRTSRTGQPIEGAASQPAFAMGSLNLPVPPTERILQVELTPDQAQVSPGAQVQVDVRVRDAAGQPLKDAQVALVVVDESILALTGYTMADPMALFYAFRPAEVSDYHLRNAVLLPDLDIDLSMSGVGADGSLGGIGMVGSGRGGGGYGRRSDSKKSAPSAVRMKRKNNVMDDYDAAPLLAMAEMDAAPEPDSAGGATQGPIALRENFNPLAAFAPAVTTDSSGKATLSVKMPDNLTRYRIMAIAAHGPTRFGMAEAAVTARMPLMVRPSAPRFLNFGDSFELPVVLQNQTDEPMQVELAARATNLELTQGQGFAFNVPARDRVEVRFPATTGLAGTARVQIAAQSGPHTDAASLSLPVWTPATTEAFATYGVIDQGAVAQAVKMPEGVYTQFGGLEISLSSTALHALTDAFLYLYRYPYECSEQIASRMLSITALRDVLKAFNAAELPTDAAMASSMKQDLDKLATRQHYSGGFGLWRPNQQPWPYVSLHVIHALKRAQLKGYKPDAQVMRRSDNYLRSIQRHIPSHYHPWTKRIIRAYALYIRALGGDRDRAEAKKIMGEVGKLEELPLESMGWLLFTLTGDGAFAPEQAAIMTSLNNRVSETAGAANFAANVSMEHGYLVMHSDRRADAVILEALVAHDPKSDLLPKLVQGLLNHRKKGRWGNTQENSAVLLALDSYFQAFEKQTPDFIARVWLGPAFAGQHTFKGYQGTRHQLDVPMKALDALDGTQDLILQKDGKGRLYYRIGMSYAPKDLRLPAAEHGFVVQRLYEPMDQDRDVQRLPDGTWKIRAGARVKIKLTMVAPDRRYHVALVDPLPAGLEALNPALATTGDLPADPEQASKRNPWWWWSRPWYEHQNMRDERVEAFSTLVWGGVHTYTYYARATTPGTFVVPPAKAEEMYAPETFGRSASDIVRVE